MAVVGKSTAGGQPLPLIPAQLEAGFGVYVHWPFCAQKCPYCDFNSHVRTSRRDGQAGWDEARFLSGYLRELQHFRELTGPRPVGSIFFGGGTPSLMQGETVAAILAEIARLWNIEDNAEITLEANPGSVEAGRFRDYRAAGVNRVSLGVQSLIPEELKALGRIHSVEEAKSALRIANETFERVSFDLIYSRSAQTPEAWSKELAEALVFGPSHLSLYQLTIEPGTMFERLYRAGKLVVPDDDAAAEMFEITQEMTEVAGLPAYEVSNHARPGEESRHNLVYWRYGEYAGTGPGAHGRVVSESGRLATVTERHPETWLERVEASGHGICEEEPISREAGADEILLMGLRLREGLDLERLRQVGGVKPGRELVQGLVDQGVLEILDGGRRIRAAGGGRFLINELVLQLSRSFVPAGEDVVDS